MSSSFAACSSPVFPRPRPGREVLGHQRWNRSHRCWSWRCSGCAQLKSQDVAKLVRVGVRRHLLAGVPLVLLTVTEPSDPRPFPSSSKALTSLMKRCRARFNDDLRWVAVGEWQERGAIHWHVLIGGLAYCRAVRSKTRHLWAGHQRGAFPVEVRKQDFVPLVARYGFGKVFNLHAVGAQGNPVDIGGNVAEYLSKYLSKNDDMRRLPKGAQPVRVSRGQHAWAPGMTLTGIRDEKRRAAKERGGDG